MKHFAALAAALAVATADPAFAVQPVPEVPYGSDMTEAQLIQSAIDDPARPQADRDKDKDRHPAEVLAFIDLKPAGSVIDFWPGSGYWTRLFSKIVGPGGHVVEWVPREIKDMKGDPIETAKQLTNDAPFDNVSVVAQPIDASTLTADLFDIVWTFENYHDLHNSFMHGASIAAFNKTIYRTLKPGGAFLIGDHAAAPGSGLKSTEDLHRIDPAAVKAEVGAAGLAYTDALTILANPRDDHTKPVFDPAMRGHTDRFVLRFAKPAN